jgi:ankyrin repeat protein
MDYSNKDINITSTHVGLMHVLIRPYVEQALRLLCTVPEQGVMTDQLGLICVNKSEHDALTLKLLQLQFSGNDITAGVENVCRLLYENDFYSKTPGKLGVLLPFLHESCGVPISASQSSRIQEISDEYEPQLRYGPWLGLKRDTVIMGRHYGFAYDLENIRSKIDSYLAGYSDPTSLGEEDSRQNIHFGGRNTLLHACSFYGFVEEAKRLLENGTCEIDDVNDGNNTALNLACRGGHAEIVDLLLSEGADASIVNVDGESPLFWLGSLPQHQNLYFARRLLENDDSLLCYFSGDERGEWKHFNLTGNVNLLTNGQLRSNPLMRAILNRDVRTVLILTRLTVGQLDFVNDDDSISDDQITILTNFFMPRPLRLACKLHLFDVLDAILCEIFSQVFDIQTRTPNLLGKLFGPSDLPIFLVMDVFSTEFALNRLIYHKQNHKNATMKTVEVLRKFGFLDEPSFPGGRPALLSLAINLENTSVLECILMEDDAISYINMPNHSGLIPTQEALNMRNFSIFSLLVNKGGLIDTRQLASPDSTPAERTTTYLYGLSSMRVYDTRFATLIIDKGVDPLFVDSSGAHVLSRALWRCNFNLATALMERGASLMDTDPYEINPGQISSLPILFGMFVPGYADQFEDLIATLKFILDRGSRIDAPLFSLDPTIDLSALHFAVSAVPKVDVYPQMLQLLANYFSFKDKIDMRANNATRSTPLQIAVAMNNKVAVKVLLSAGANIHIVDPKEQSTMDIAITALDRLRRLPLDMIHGDYDEKSNNALDLVELLLPHFPSFGSLGNILSPLEVVDKIRAKVAQMTKLEHCTQFSRRLESEVFDLTDQIENVDIEFPAMAELFSRSLSKLIQPIFYTSVVFRVIGPVNSNPSEVLQAIRKQLPWCVLLNDTMLKELQQAAAFEWLLEEALKAHCERPKSGFSLESLSAYARSRSVEDLPFNQQYVQWPQPLLQCYLKCVQTIGLALLPPEQTLFGDVIELLQGRQAARRNNTWVPPLTPDFQDLHFCKLQAGRLNFETFDISIQSVTNCRCAKVDVGKVAWRDVLSDSRSTWNYDTEGWEQLIRDTKSRSSTTISQSQQ